MTGDFSFTMQVPQPAPILQVQFAMLGVSVQVQPAFLTMSDFLSAETASSFDCGSGMPNKTGETTTKSSVRSSTLAGTALRLAVQDCATSTTGNRVRTENSSEPPSPSRTASNS